MKTPVNDFDFFLPDELIAQYPADVRGTSKLLAVNRQTKSIEDKVFTDIVDYLTNECFLVVNNTRVMKARLFGQKPTGGKVEVFLLEEVEDGLFKAMTRGKVKVGTVINISATSQVVVEKFVEDGLRLVSFRGLDPYEIMEQFGHIPLPPYIKREDEELDKKMYQTVYSSDAKSVAAPTAGLHFTGDILKALESKGVEKFEVSLDIGVGTFRPVQADFLEDHIMHTEKYHVTNEVAEKINTLKENGKKLVAVGTTAMRTLESATDESGVLHAGRSATDIFIKPGYKFKSVDHMVTNFHLPKSTLVVLISAFMGKKFAFEAYEHAVKNKYRFFSYGDSMLIL
jgi:S-adenosylmethionine:tRNA ribosyltransferase-isomerase